MACDVARRITISCVSRPGVQDEGVPFTRDELEAMAEEEALRQLRDARRRALRNLIGSIEVIAGMSDLRLPLAARTPHGRNTLNAYSSRRLAF